jgi:hypothetical protein
MAALLLLEAVMSIFGRSFNSLKNAEFYREDWHTYYVERHRGVARLGLLAAGTSILALLFGLVPNQFIETHHIFSLFVAILSGCLWLAIGVSWFSLIWKMSSWECPHCGQPFFYSTFVRNPFGRHCRHCGLRRLKKSEVAESVS